MSACAIRDCASTQPVRTGGVCDDCWTVARQNALRAIPGLWVGLHAHLGKASRGPSEPIARQPAGSRSPLSDAVLDALRAVPMDLAGWANESLICRDRELLRLAGKRWGRVLSEALDTLACHDEILRYGPAAPDYVTAVLAMRSRMLHLSGLERLVHHLPTPCPGCNRRGLIRHNGQSVVLCPMCGLRWSDAEYHRHVLRVAQSL